MIGQTLNKRYKILSQLGEGGMGEVYLADDEKTGTQVAVKILARQLTANPEALERFKREGETLRQLDHPNIVKFIDAFEHDKQYVIVMEYVSGGNLQKLIKQGALPIEQARQITLDLCDALIRAHRLNIIHRDLKPENVLITENGTPKLADFGVARLSESTSMTRSGTQVGTPYYMAPEAWEGKTLDAQADIWSLGIMLFEMIAGKVPFGGETGAAVMNKILTTQPPDLRKLRSDIPSNLTKIIRRMLTRDKKNRYPTMREVAVELEREQNFRSSRPLKNTDEKSITWKKVVSIGIAIIVVGLFFSPQVFKNLKPSNSNSNNSLLIMPTTSSIPSIETTTITTNTLLIEDDFSNPSFEEKVNTDLWIQFVNTPNYIKQQDGELVFLLESNSGETISLFSKKTLSISQLISAEAKMSLSSEKPGRDGDIGLALITKDAQYRDVIFLCVISRFQPPQTWCEVYGRTNVAEYSTGRKNTNYDTWHNFRITIDSNVQATFYIDEQEIGSYTPTDANALKNKFFQVRLEVWTPEQTGISAKFDNLRISSED